VTGPDTGMYEMTRDVDVLIVGGGVAGLWTLDHLRRLGYEVALVENRALGSGQTIASQGIIHGGLKYSLRGMLTASAKEIREMPLIWRECLSGSREPNLSRVDVRSHSCYLWQTTAIASQAGMVGARLSLHVKPQSVPEHSRPSVLESISGKVYRLDEQVLSPGSLLECFRRRNEETLYRCEAENGIAWETETSGEVVSATIRSGDHKLTFRPRSVILTAGAGNDVLSSETGKQHAMQRRPLHMVMVRGNLPLFQGHCIDGAKTRLTISSEVVSSTETVWQLGGALAEQGVGLTPTQLIAHAIEELRATLPDIDPATLKFATYEVDRAERKSGLGLRPDTPQLILHKNTITCWPTKLAFAPRVAEMSAQMLSRDLKLTPQTAGEAVATKENVTNNWPRPDVASPPWCSVKQWYVWRSGELQPAAKDVADAA